MKDTRTSESIRECLSGALLTEDGCDSCNYAVLVLLVAISLYAGIAVAVQGSENKHFIVVLPRLFNMRGSATNETVGIGTTTSDICNCRRTQLL